MPNAYPPQQATLDIFDQLRALVRAERRDPAAIGIEVWTSCGAGTPDDWQEEIAFWKSAGATHVTLTTAFNRRHHRRIAGHKPADHLAALERFRAAVKDEL